MQIAPTTAAPHTHRAVHSAFAVATISPPPHHLHPATPISPSIFPCALRAATNLRLPGLGLQLQALLTKTGLMDSPFSTSAFLHLYATLTLPSPKSASRVPWNTLILRWWSVVSQLVHPPGMLSLPDASVPEREHSPLACSAKWFQPEALANVDTFNTLLHVIVVLQGANVLRELHGFVLWNTEIVGFGLVDLDRLRKSLAVGYMRSCCVEYADRAF
ncbi:hypothetical protein E2562_025461 [Oryza meyeriana var. granulata]|uniref:Uncharacterized protein n=1 Tax=Oryza meyeriana var. granulata TaxID=110450 RepID=A0A6G1D7Z0_9ORYZ|nr:hypothetical protein E2562_025461 [Oryza meyeriana var. granulata]